MLARAQRFVDSWVEQARHCRIQSELVLVACTAPGTLSDQLRPPNQGPCELVCIDVPNESLIRPNRAAPPRYVRRMLRNMGIRRARGEFILTSDIDVLLSNELAEFLAARRLEHGRMYRIDTYEVDGGPPHGASVLQQLAYCRSHAARLFAREGTFALAPDGLRHNFAADIASTHSGSNFGPGWFPPERHPESGETIRWMESGAEILARVPDGGGVLTFELEPGPGTESLPQQLQIVDETSAQIASWNIDARIVNVLHVPASEGGKLKRLQFHLSGAGSPVLDDPRILDLAVFRCDWAEPNLPVSAPGSLISSFRHNGPLLKRLLGTLRDERSLTALLTKSPILTTRAARLLARRGKDIFQAGMDFQLDPGWYYLEESVGERFRWISKDARLLLRMPKPASRLAMLVEPGPAKQSFNLIVRSTDERGDLLGKVQVRGLTYFEFPAPAAAGTIAPLYLTADPPAPPGDEDPRLLSFRVFAFGAGARISNSASKSWDWLTFSLGSKPAAKDWISALEPDRREIAQMGKPTYLHTNAAGNFILMSRVHWFDLRGFPELDLPSGHVDSLLCYAAHHAGVREQVLEDPLRIYSFAADTPAEPALSPQWQAALREDLIWLIRQMRAVQTPVLFNPDPWS